MRIALIGISLISVLFLSGCAKEMIYVRLDGQRSASDPVLAQQFQVDAAICQGEMQRANVSGVTFTGGGIAGAVAAAERSNAVGQVAQGCMAQRGYLIVPKEQAEAKLAELAAVAEEKKRREAAAQAAVVIEPLDSQTFVYKTDGFPIVEDIQVTTADGRNTFCPRTEIHAIHRDKTYKIIRQEAASA